MIEDSLIEWCDGTFSPWHGCCKISDGCKNCYAEVSTPVRVKRHRGLTLWGPKKTSSRDRTAKSTWDQVRALARKVRKFPDRCTKCGTRVNLHELFQENLEPTICPARLNSKGKWDSSAPICGGEVQRNHHPRIFPSLCDPFEDHPDADKVRPDFWKLIEETPEITWLLLTKRTRNIRKMVPSEWIHRWPHHVGIGASVEDQKTANERIKELAGIPAWFRFLSVEPLLAPVFLTRVNLRSAAMALEPAPLPGKSPGDACRCSRCSLPRNTVDQRSIGFANILPSRQHRCPPGYEGENIHWVIIGGESGDYARKCDIAWIRSLINECHEAGVPCFVKQLGADVDDTIEGRPQFTSLMLKHPKGGDPDEWTPDLRVRQLPDFRP